jgi:superfamily I DNA/RNA helicase
VAGISVDPPSHNRAMVEKLDLPFPLLSDPKGDLIKSLDLWNEEEGVSEPAIVVVDRSGTVRRLYSGGKDFSDRPTEEALFALLDEVGTEGEPEGGEAIIRVFAGEAAAETVRPDKPALTLDELEPYYLGTYFATVAMQNKLDGEAREEVDDYQNLVKEYETAIRETADRNAS